MHRYFWCNRATSKPVTVCGKFKGCCDACVDSHCCTCSLFDGKEMLICNPLWVYQSGDGDIWGTETSICSFAEDIVHFCRLQGICRTISTADMIFARELLTALNGSLDFGVAEPSPCLEFDRLVISLCLGRASRHVLTGDAVLLALPCVYCT